MVYKNNSKCYNNKSNKIKNSLNKMLIIIKYVMIKKIYKNKLKTKLTSNPLLNQCLYNKMI